MWQVANGSDNSAFYSILLVTWSSVRRRFLFPLARQNSMFLDFFREKYYLFWTAVFKVKILPSTGKESADAHAWWNRPRRSSSPSSDLRDWTKNHKKYLLGDATKYLLLQGEEKEIFSFGQTHNSASWGFLLVFVSLQCNHLKFA